jgi:hypothetical protein
MEPLAKLVANARPPLRGRKHDMHKTADPAMRHDRASIRNKHCDQAPS